MHNYHYYVDNNEPEQFIGCGPVRSTGYVENKNTPGMFYSHTQKASHSTARCSPYLIFYHSLNLHVATNYYNRGSSL